MNYALILAGGSGTRFWPLSRNTEPKQFLSVCSDKPMLEETIQRILPLIKKENILIAANKIHRQKIYECARKIGIPQDNIFLEPESRNTFAPIAFLSYKINTIDPEAILCVLPCDHVIQNNKKYVSCLAKATNAASENCIVTFGVTPKRPETGYGYIKIELPGHPLNFAKGKQITRSQVYKIEKFIEKPNLNKAKKLIKNKRYYWNSGIFVFKAGCLLDEIKRLQPKSYKEIAKKNKSLEALWKTLPATSIDYAVMERARNLTLLPADYGWLDLGSWQAIEEVLKKDKSRNILRGNCVDLDSKDSIIWGQKRLIASVGLKNIIVVDTEDALLICAKDRTQDVKRIVQILKEKKLSGQI